VLRLYLIRHGETVWNQHSKYQGHTDVPLSETGLIQAQRVAQRLKGEDLDAVYSSDLSRARVTAQLIAQEHGLSVASFPALREVNYGSWEGLTLFEINAGFPGVREQWLSDPENFRIPEGESLGQVQKRALACIDEIRLRHFGGTIAIVSHGGLIAMLLLTFLKEEASFLRGFFARNTSVSLIEFEGPVIKVVYWGDASHLDE
jgi:alpha-ribazole phosphatase